MNDEDATTRAADLAERIVDEVSGADQSWRTIERLARELAELAARMAAQRATGTVRSTADGR